MSLYTTMMDSVASLIRPSISRGTGKGTRQTFDNVLITDELCSVQPASSNIRLIYAQRGMDVSVTIFFTRDIGAEPSDVIDTVDDQGKSHRFLVQGFNTKVYNRLLCPYECHCEERPYPTSKTGA